MFAFSFLRFTQKKKKRDIRFENEEGQAEKAKYLFVFGES